ncbi:Pycsar system effector family protein [Streptomyces sp. NPDC051642]|uniref:Pycsar system effector family protein n=1 Tax=Streptomyces sp. NPDC051642 TaxID=3154646 RepID=UPI00343AD4C2
MLQSDSTRLPVRIVSLIAVIFSMLSLVEGLNVIKKLSKRSSRGRSRSHLLYFGTFARLSAPEAVAALSAVDDSRYLAELAAQSVSLAKNLRMRYDALGKAYRWLAVSVVAFVVALAVQQAYFLGKDSPSNGSPSTTVRPVRNPISQSPAVSLAPRSSEPSAALASPSATVAPPETDKGRDR